MSAMIETAGSSALTKWEWLKFLTFMVFFVVIAIGCIIVFTFPDCPTEDSTMCIWNAKVQGNGQGYSFIAFWEGAFIRFGEYNA